jgi:pilus assembly protein Flp/PilA
MKSLFSRFVKDESGATAIEYGLIAAIVGVGIIASLGTLKNGLNNTFDKVANNMTSAR